MTEDDCETWLLDAGDHVIKKAAASGDSSLSSLERLILCLWTADYGMRNAGDLTVADDLHPTLLADGKSAAQELGLPRSLEAFSLSPQELEQQYFDLFVEVTSEIRDASSGLYTTH